MASPHHDTGYKELFSHPELVEQLIDGFAPSEIAALMDFSTLEQHNGHYITPLYEEKIEDVVWSVDATWEGVTQRVYLYILLEFQSTVDQRMPLRMMHYVASFHDHLIKNGVTTAKKGLPPVFPVVLYNGNQPWTAVEDVYQMVRPKPPGFLRVYQPHLRYYLVEERSYSDEDLAERNSPLSGVFGVENAKSGYEALQSAVDRMLASIQAHPHKERMDEIITRWFKRHLKWLGTDVGADELSSLMEDRDMLADNLESWAKRERQEGVNEGVQQGRIDSLRSLIILKFNDVPEWAEQRITAASNDQLKKWIENTLKAESLEAVFND
ncbi:Rpn family recombination-promoting nuclease/putative transposase [Vreelandella jeotgali]|uniref:Rpn family recombination-promoting nuclease/putative transposase n=1 Tax=Vreelandella jeotgali TaxID=553386 RepID=UPI00034BD6DE|nr:Rpn family recombination-promoting nuclease/putative transposase [Halomonas jeotgali]